MIIEFSDVIADPKEYLPHHSSQLESSEPQSDRGLAEVLRFIEGSGFTFEPWQVATFVTALRTKPFLILAGISGTGKTKLPQLVAEATGAKAVIVPVRPDWTDSSDLLGYERLNGEFVPGHLLSVCVEAIANPDVQYFFILDEMNVARVEYYFAEVLSVMENRRRNSEGIISEPLNRSARGLVNDTDIEWSSIYLPSNVAIVGTVNMDETTHGFSRKVLDRAFVLELSEVDLTDYQSRATAPMNTSNWGSSAWTSPYLRLSDIEEPESKQTITEAVNTLVRANESLQSAQLQIGFRVRDEVALFCHNATEFNDFFVDRAESVVPPLDLCLSMKILPRIQGGGALIGDVLSDLESWTAPNHVDSDESESPVGFNRTHERVQLMQQRLDHTGFTSYWI